jgi:transposase
MIDLQNENRLDVLRQAALLLDSENKRLIKRTEALMSENAELQGKSPEQLQQEILALQELLAQRESALFGRSSERRGSGSAKPRTQHGPTPQAKLPVVETEYDLDEPDKTCPKCGGTMTEMVGHFEESDEIDVVERHFVVRRHRRKKYRCSCNSCIETALGPVKLRAGNRYSIDFAIDVAMAKYGDHLPLERQVRIMAREGLKVTSQTLFEQLHALAEHLRPACTALHAEILKAPVLCADETRWPMLNGRGAECIAAGKWHAWSICSQQAVSYQIHDNRSQKAAKRVLGDYAGTLTADGFGVYGAVARAGKFTLAHCWVHARRRFFQAEKFFPKAREMLDMIGELYEIEKRATGPPGTAEHLAQLRQLRNTTSREVVGRIKTWSLEQRVLPGSAIGKAISYLHKIWPGLVLFLDDPRIPLDTNSVERSLRGVVKTGSLCVTPSSGRYFEFQLVD